MLPLLQHLSASAAASLITSTVEAALLAISVAICLRLIPDLSATVRSILWTAVFLVAAALPFLTPTASGSPSTSTATPIALSIDWAIGIAAFWAALSLFRIAQLLRSAVHLNGVARRSELIISDAASHAPIATSTEIDIPCVAGFFAPRILIPTSLYAALPPSELAQIITHEQAHLNRFDHWTNLLQKLLIALYPIHPVLLWIERRLCIERELACDDAVLRQTGARKQYALCLTNLAENGLARRGFTLALRAWERQSELTRRVLRILEVPTRQLRPTQSAAVVATLLAALTTGATTLAHTPQFISFSTPEAPQSLHESLRAPSIAELHRDGWDVNSHPATFTPTTKPTMVNTSMELPTKPKKSLTKLKPTKKHSTPITQAALRQTQPQQWIMLTTFQSTEAPAHYHQAIFQISDATYAAVPTQAGWLIIEL
ncbi:M56 family metallopeptidase [Granulicella tundricola]|uniref:Peptidase M56 BlaR1 n=1 Tax=Granulicella tundricola (strain ATCC BAA-1859 / DSM 23138 / MP5ACTX9) TaxID=1198114 RepID=E8X4G7_GRATM|nr:M56 family metallopeptidase [Granulicella tundricola]ADW68294.1 peptidase M56 BlaR1 [Granulicella tundricola MP5ACTX9]